MSFSLHHDQDNEVFHEASSGGHRFNPWMWGGGIVIVLLLLFIGSLLAAGGVLAGSLDGRDAAERAQDHLAKLEIEGAIEDLAEAQASFASAGRSLSFLAPVQVLPWVGDHYRASRALLGAGETASRVFARTLETGMEALELIGEDTDLLNSSNTKGELVSQWTGLDRETRQFVLARLATRLPTLELARNDLHLTLEELEEAFDEDVFSLLWTQKQQLVVQLNVAEQYLETLVQGVALLTSVSGEDGGTILLVFLNDNELRPGGGFIGSFGLLDLDAGAIADLSTYDVMAVDGPATESRTTIPPEPLAEYLGVPAWFLRDANWSPDFATSAQQILQFFSEELVLAGDEAVVDPEKKIDAVVGLTTSVAGDLLAVLGDIEVDGERFTSDNIADALENAVEFTFVNRGVTHDHRKDIIQDIVDVMRDRLTALTLDEWSQVFTSVAVRLQDKNLMLYSPEEDIQRLFVRQGWAGEVAQQFDGDYVMLVDANLAALKSDPAVRRFIRYELSAQEGELLATTTVTYQHTRGFDPKTTRYRTFTRLYAPEGSELLRVEGSLANDRLKNPGLLEDEPVIANELGKTTFGVFTSVEPLTTHDLVFHYRLPDHLYDQFMRGSYDLLVQKQLGAQNHALTLDLDFGTNVESAIPAEESNEWGDTRYRVNTILDQDQPFSIDL